MDKLVLRKVHGVGELLKPTQIYASTWEKLKALNEETGISIVQLIALMVDFASDHCEIIEK